MHQRDNIMKGGVIIIGSLLWDDERIRRSWRENHLCHSRGFRVYLPIRYGRHSSTRYDTYTIVLSNKCYSKGYKLGSGWVLPSRAEINSFSDFKNEAKKMGAVEGFEDGFTALWGSVALIFNPDKEADEGIRGMWSNFMSRKLSDHPLLSAKLKTEKPSINPNGFLTIKWPKEVTPEGKIDDMDFLIATVTKPTLIKGRYPTVNQIANAMNQAKYFNYFLNNQKHGIVTFQDKRILKRININCAHEHSSHKVSV